MLRSNGRRMMVLGGLRSCTGASSPLMPLMPLMTTRAYGDSPPAGESEQDRAVREGVLRGFDQMQSLERMEVEGRATLPDGKSGVTLILQGSGKIMQVKVDEDVAGNVENVEKLFVAASQNARQKIADRINSMLAASHQ